MWASAPTAWFFQRPLQACRTRALAPWPALPSSAEPPAANNLLGWCNVATPGITFGGGPITLNSSGGTTFTPPGSHGGTYNLTEGTPDGDGGFVPLSYDTTNLKQSFSVLFSLPANTRMRAVLTTDKCTPTTGSGPGSGSYDVQSITEDFDLFLCPASGGGACIAESRSVYDNKEGFDVTVAAAGSYRLSAVYDADASVGCNGSFSHAAAYAFAWGSPSFFIEAP